jgi:GntR family transcriptional regulator
MGNPMYRQIAEDLRAQIESGKIKRGQQLQTEIELRERYGASRNTIRDAIKLLTTLALVETRPGQGTFVVNKIDPFVTTLSGDPGSAGVSEGTSYRSEVAKRDRVAENSAIQLEIQQAPELIAAGLWVPVGTEVISRHERRSIDDTPWSMQTSYYPMKFVERGAARLLSSQDIPEGTTHYLRESLGIKQVGYRVWVTVRAPNPIEADFFKLPSDGRIPVYEIFQTAFDGNGQAMRLTVTIYPADRNQFIFEFGQVPEDQYGPSTDESGAEAGAP